MENREGAAASDDLREQESQEGANTFEIETDGKEGEILEGTITVNGGEAAANGKLPDISLLSAGIAAAAVLLLVCVLVMVGIKRKRREQSEKKRRNTEENKNGQAEWREEVTTVSGDRVPDGDTASCGKSVRIGKVHNIGKRSAQQDSLGVTDVPGGVFAVVADGMGGLADGDKVSQTIVMTMLQEISGQCGSDREARLFETVSHANDAVNRMLGMQSQYVSGSTVVAALAHEDCFEWVSVGDSRVCLYRGGRLIQLNREHNYESELLWQAVNGEISFAEVRDDPKRRSLTSFIGMGRLKYIDGSIKPVEAASGDCLLLMSDGVFNTLSDDELCAVLQEYPDPQQAARAIEERMLAYDMPKQDNFTAVLLKFCHVESP